MRNQIVINLLAAGLVGCVLAGLVGCAGQQPSQPEPTLVCEKDGVKLWRVKDLFNSETVYFTTPSGDVSRAEMRGAGNGTDPQKIRKQTVSGVEKE